MMSHCIHVSLCKAVYQSGSFEYVHTKLHYAKHMKIIKYMVITILLALWLV